MKYNNNSGSEQRYSELGIEKQDELLLSYGFGPVGYIVFLVPVGYIVGLLLL